jgi:hypothetical protein
MIEYFHLDEKSRVNKTLPKNRLLVRIQDEEKRKLVDKLVKNIVWPASIRPQETKIAAFENDKVKYEEIPILEIELKSYSEYNEFYDIVSSINKSIAYPTIFIIKYGEKYRIIMIKQRKNRKNNTSFVKEDMLITYWIYPESPSEITDRIIGYLNIKIYKPKTMFDLYSELYNNLLQYKRKCLQETTFSFFFSEIIKMEINDEEDEIDFIMEKCKGEKYKPPKSGKFVDKYSHQADRDTMPKYQYDYEDVWQIIINRPKIKKYLKQKNISNMEMLMETINNQKKEKYFFMKFGNIDKIGNDYINDVLFWGESDEYEEDKFNPDPNTDDFDTDDYTKLMDKWGNND